MPAYLKIEELQDNSDISLAKDLMGISLLALLVSPWALVGLALSSLNVSFMTTEILIICISVLIVSLPKLIQLLIPSHKKYSDMIKPV
ncbi:MAG: hypothetical protein ACE5E3_03095 [Mariprofundus sp.]